MKYFTTVKPNIGSSYRAATWGCWAAVWDWINAYYERTGTDLPSDALIVVEGEDGTRLSLEANGFNRLEIAPAAWELLHSIFGASVGVVDYRHVDADDEIISGIYISFAAVYLTGEDGENVLVPAPGVKDSAFPLTFFQLMDLISEVQDLAKVVTKSLRRLPTAPSVPAVPSQGDPSSDEISRTVSIVSSAIWRESAHATKEVGSCGLRVGYAGAEAAGLDIEANAADRDMASEIKPPLALPTVPSVPVVPSQSDLSKDEIARIVSIVSNGIWRKSYQATKKAGSNELWVGYAVAEAMDLDIDANPADRGRASEVVNNLIRDGILSFYSDRDAKSNLREYVCVCEENSCLSLP